MSRSRMVSLVHMLRRFARSSRGVAAVEFALVLPFMLLLYLGSIELSAAISVDKRVTVAAGSLGDLVARADTSISTSTLNDYFTAAGATMAPYDDTTLKQVVTCVKIDSSGNATVLWSKGYNGGTPHPDDSTFDVPTDLKNLQLDNYVIVSEAAMPYDPMFGYVFKNAFDLYHEFFYVPRYGDKIELT